MMTVASCSRHALASASPRPEHAACDEDTRAIKLCGVESAVCGLECSG
jgi:hypothetical protein